ncbi:MAG: tetratricopeptide repeat protein [Piscinibacter sp.]|uniref:tetratricopeptide repeat protein n=1 Tax=Piscinibacter sp. TaxID=1903157 RepID=UPI0025881D64|nr:tetratricopeptide repeat protein [Piscinibacter sp.]MCW5665784.1 tetratricopeptide repeat protein [Piscinibacter sp.]
MPVFPIRSSLTRLLGALTASLLCATLATSAQTERAGTAPVVNSRLDAQLFYQLLIGEIELREGDAGTAYQVMLDAARRTKDEQLFRRATDIALQARAGDQALAAVMAWRSAVPSSAEAHRYLIQLLIALNRPAEAVEPMRALVELTPSGERGALIQSLPAFFSRQNDKAQAAALIEKTLQPFADGGADRVPARVAMARAWLGVPDAAKARALLERAHADAPTDESPALLAAVALGSVPELEGVILGHLRAKPDSHGVRLAYVRALTSVQRFVDAVTQLQEVTRRAPELPPPWLTLGALQLELRQPADATASLQTYLERLDAAPAPTLATPAHGGGADDDDDTPSPAAGAEQGRTQAWLLLAQAAEQRRDFKAAETWLAKVDNPQRLLEVQTRRASLLARQGKLREARELIRRVPEREQSDVRAKLLAEAQVLRDVKQWKDAGAVLAQANQRFPDDVELLYEQSMMAEKLNRMDEMERLLRKVIQLKPDHHHAYNALGYSLAERNQRLPEAKSLIQKALELSPGEPFITDSLGWVEYRMGNKAEALRLLKTAYQARPDPEIAAHLGEVLWVMGQQDEARRVWREARSRDSANDVLRETLARLRVDL